MTNYVDSILELWKLNRLYRKPFAPEKLLQRGHVKCFAAAVIESRRRKDIAQRRNAVRGRVKRLAAAYLENHDNGKAAV